VLRVVEFQIAVNIIYQSAIRFVDHLGENMVTHVKSRNFIAFNNWAFLPRLAFFSKDVWQPCLTARKANGSPSWTSNAISLRQVEPFSYQRQHLADASGSNETNITN